MLLPGQAGDVIDNEIGARGGVGVRALNNEFIVLASPMYRLVA